MKGRTFSESINALLEVLAKGADPGAVLHLHQSSGPSLVGAARETRIEVRALDGLLPVPILNLAESPAGTYLPWRVEVPPSTVAAVVFNFPMRGQDRGRIGPGDLEPDRAAMRDALDRASALAPPSAVVLTDSEVYALWSVKATASEVRSLTVRVAAHLGAQPAASVPIPGFVSKSQALDRAELHSADASRVCDVEEFKFDAALVAAGSEI